jgi:AcrR family transcriptional regulator
MARPLSAAARRKMIEATQELALERGLDGFTVDEVARRSGVAKTTIYRHFDSGDHLLLSAIGALIEEIEVPDTGSLAGDMRETLASLTPLVTSHGLRRLLVSLLNRSISDPEFAAMHRAMVDDRRKPLEIILERARARGEVRADLDLQHVIPFAEGPFVVHSLIEQGELDDAQREQWIDLVVRAVAPD